MSAAIVLQQMLIIFILILAGYGACKRGIIPADISRGLSSLVLNICNPMLLIRSALNRDPSLTNQKLWTALLAGGIVYLLLLLFSRILPWCLHIEKKWKNHYAMMCMFGNVGFIGIPLASSVLGDEALIYVAIINGYFNLIFYTYGIRLADDSTGRIEWRKLLNVGNMAILSMIVLFLWQPELPVVITESIDYMANATTFIAMVVIGISLARTKLRDIFTRKELYLFVALRFLAVPFVISLVLRQFIRDEVIYGTMLLMSAMPVANLPLMVVEEKGGDGELLSQGIILSTILSLITIPLAMLFVQM